MCWSVPEVGDAQVGLLAVAQIGLGNEDVAHGEHAQASNLLGTVEDDRWEPARHLTVQPNLDTLQQHNEDEITAASQVLLTTTVLHAAARKRKDQDCCATVYRLQTRKVEASQPVGQSKLATLHPECTAL